MPTTCYLDLCSLKHDSSAWGIIFATPSNFDALNEIIFGDGDTPIHQIGVDQAVDTGTAIEFQMAINNGEAVPPPGTVVAWIKSLLGYTLLREDSVVITGRLFSRGDLVVSGERPGQTGIVLHSKSSCSLQPLWTVKHRDHAQPLPCMPRNPIAQSGSAVALSGNGLVPDIDLTDLILETPLHVGTPVLYSGWAGLAIGVEEEKTIRLFNNSVVVLGHEVALNQAGDPKSSDPPTQLFEPGALVSARKTDLRLGRWLYGCYDANLAPFGVVVKVRPTRIRVQWQTHRSDRSAAEVDHTLQPPPEWLGLYEIESPSFYLYELEKVTRNNQLLETHAHGFLVAHVRFSDLESARQKYSDPRLFQNPRQENLGFDMNIFKLAEVKSMVTVQWQDASITTHPSLTLLKTEVTESNELHPGALVCTLEMKPLSENPTAGFADVPRKVGIVQSCNQNKGLAKVRWFKHPQVYLEKNKDYTTLPACPCRCGELDEESEDVSIYDIVLPGGLDFVRFDFVMLRNKPSSMPNENDRSWFGVITNVHSDATVSVRFTGENITEDVRVHVDEIEIALDMEGGSIDGSHHNGDQDMVNGSDGGPASDWSSGSDISMEDYGAILMGDRQERVDYIMEDTGDVRSELASDHSSAWSTASEGVAEQNTTTAKPAAMETSIQPVTTVPESDLVQPDPYILHEGSAPTDHIYAGEAGSVSGASLRKIMKEHAILSSKSAIPSGIYVHSWEGNCNLFWAIIVGPTETPYARCPFMFDIMLPASYPSKPPRVFFRHWRHSQSGADRRINPNLYEDGTVCLSLLNTWPGASTEGWMPGKSTLLQTLISIQSLILVPEPYYNEPGFEAKREVVGTKTSSVAFNELTLLQARGFLLFVLEKLGTVQWSNTRLSAIWKSIKDVYLGPGNLLQSLIQDDNALIDRSKRADEDMQSRRDGVSMISVGACLRLERMLRSLQALDRSVSQNGGG